MRRYDKQARSATRPSGLRSETDRGAADLKMVRTTRSLQDAR